MNLPSISNLLNVIFFCKLASHSQPQSLATSLGKCFKMSCSGSTKTNSEGSFSNSTLANWLTGQLVARMIQNASANVGRRRSASSSVGRVVHVPALGSSIGHLICLFGPSHARRTCDVTLKTCLNSSSSFLFPSLAKGHLYVAT